MTQHKQSPDAPVITFTRIEEKRPQIRSILERYPSPTLLACLHRAVELEEYEEASIYRDELNKRKGELCETPDHKIF